MRTTTEIAGIQGDFFNHAVQPSAIDTEKIGDSPQLALLGASYDDPSPDVVFDALGSALSGAPLAEILANVARIIGEHSNTGERGSPALVFIKIQCAVKLRLLDRSSSWEDFRRRRSRISIDKRN